MAIKIDLEKAYDRITWEFLRYTLKDIGLFDTFINVIMAISTCSMKVAINGDITNKFMMSRGIRQGDPLLLYLFMLCIERLGRLIKEAIRMGEWKPIKLTTEGPLISHLFFANYLMVFGEAFRSQINIINQCLGLFYGEG